MSFDDTTQPAPPVEIVSDVLKPPRKCGYRCNAAGCDKLCCLPKGHEPKHDPKAFSLCSDRLLWGLG